MEHHAVSYFVSSASERHSRGPTRSAIHSSFLTSSTVWGAEGSEYSGLALSLCCAFVGIVQEHRRTVHGVVCKVSDNWVAETHAVHAQLVSPPCARK
jgi:hypothetical protein